jgi:hypothetical protein
MDHESAIQPVPAFRLLVCPAHLQSACDVGHCIGTVPHLCLCSAGGRRRQYLAERSQNLQGSTKLLFVGDTYDATSAPYILQSWSLSFQGHVTHTYRLVDEQQSMLAVPAVWIAPHLAIRIQHLRPQLSAGMVAWFSRASEYHFVPPPRHM